MDQDTAQALAEIRGELAQLRSALGVQGPDEAEAEVLRLRTVVQELADGLQAFLDALGGQSPATPQQAAQALAQLSATVTALGAWGTTVNPPFRPPGE